MIMALRPYFEDGMWVFDDRSVGLYREPFVRGVPEILENLLVSQQILSPEQGFLLKFSSEPFSGHQMEARWIASDGGGNWYRTESPLGDTRDGWLCPALFKYFKQAPECLYIRVESN